MNKNMNKNMNKMKNFDVKIIVVLLFMSVFSSLNAQNELQDTLDTKKKTDFSILEKRHELTLGAGFGSVLSNAIQTSFCTWGSSPNAWEDISMTLLYPIIPDLSLAYHYRINKTLAVGASLSTDFEWFHSVMFKMQFYYISNPKFSFYGDLGLGATLWCYENSNRDLTSKIIPNFGIYPIGLKFGRNAGGLIELGYGYKGIVNFGAFVKFGKSK